MSLLYTCVPKITIMWCMLPEIWNTTDLIFLSFWAISCTFTPLLTPKIKIWSKFLKKSWWYYSLHMRTINEDNMMNHSWDIRHDKLSFLSFWVIFCPLTFLTIWTIKIFKKMKKKMPENISTTNDDQMMYDSWDMEYHRQNFLSFRTIFCPFTPLTTQKIKILKKWKCL